MSYSSSFFWILVSSFCALQQGESDIAGGGSIYKNLFDKLIGGNEDTEEAVVAPEEEQAAPSSPSTTTAEQQFSSNSGTPVKMSNAVTASKAFGSLSAAKGSFCYPKDAAELEKAVAGGVCTVAVLER